MISAPCVHHLVSSSLGIALDSMDVPLRVLFSGTTTMTLLDSALHAERALHSQLKQKNAELSGEIEEWEQSILFNSAVIVRYFMALNKSTLILTISQTPITNTFASSFTSTVMFFLIKSNYYPNKPPQSGK